MKFTLILLCFFILNVTFAQKPAMGIFEKSADIGNPKIAGAAQYDEATQTYTLKGAGYNIWFERDEFHYLYKQLTGDFILTANFGFEGEKGAPHRKTGWMIRASLDDNASHISAVAHGDGLTVLQWRVLRGAFMRDPEDEIFAPKDHYQIIQLERSGKTIAMRAAHTGEPLQTIGSHDMENMPGEVFVGLFMGSHDENTIEEAKAWNVRIDKPVADDYNPNEQGFLGCRLETMNVFDGKKKVIYESSGRFEAPNWMPDGKHLLFNMDGSLYKIPVEGGDLTKLNTGAVNKSNNDHGISFDGKKLAISSSGEGTGSQVYVLPLEGGTPKLLVEKSPSYWHGWSADSKEIYYVAQRDTTIYNVYKMAVNGGKEVQLTFNKSGHVDGPEGSPDGKYIYYNANPTGTMQLWRMKPDGADPEQLTFDQYNDWFPHISPDGKWIVFISFGTEVSPSAHPSYKRVMLRLMPASGGAPRVIAYLYGGQGTMNVPSWSPDSQHIAFVSNSGK